MEFELDEDQRLLQQLVRETVAKARTQPEDQLWATYQELGWLEAPPVELAIVLEELGYVADPTPFLATATWFAHLRGNADRVAASHARQGEWWQAAVAQRADGCEPGSAAAALSPFDVLQERAAAPGYRGCPFINAAAEFPGPGPVAGQVAAHRKRVRATFSRLLGDAGSDAGLLGALIALYDGAMSAAYLDHDPSVVAHARHGAEMLLRRSSQA